MTHTTAPRRRRARIAATAPTDAAPQHQSAPNRLIYGFSRRAAQRIAEAEGAERLMLVIGAAILVYLGIRIWLVGARFTIDGVIYAASLVGFRIAYSYELWTIPILLSLAEFGLKRPKLDIFFGLWVVAFAIDATTTGLGLYPTTATLASEASRWGYALLGGAVFAWSAEACLQCGFYAIWRSYRHD